MPRPLINAFILSFLALIVIDGLPTINSIHRWLKRPVGRCVDHLGIWQRPWYLFAPNVDKINHRLEGAITFDDNHQITWRSPDWSAMGPLEHFRNFRQAEYFDNIRLDANREGWEPLANHLAAKHSRPSANVQSVKLLRAWTAIAGPSEPLLHEHHHHFFEKSF